MAPPSDQQDEHRSRPEPLRRDDVELAVAALDVDLAAHWIASSLARDRTEVWLESLRWPRAQTEELVLAVNEAVSNSVEHGYRVPPESLDHPGVVRLRGRISTADDGFRRATFTITDAGSWKTPEPQSERGMGLLIMRACTDTLDVSGSVEGTRVELVSRAVPPAPLG